MKKNLETNSKKYLNILGIITLVLGALAVIGGIVFLAMDLDLASLLGESYNEIVSQAKGDANLVKVMIGIMIMSTGASYLLMGWLERRAAKNPEKSTFLLVVTVLNIISGVYAMVNGGFSDFANASGNIVSLTINVLALMAIINLRRSIDE